jgi:hypothetical protein
MEIIKDPLFFTGEATLYFHNEPIGYFSSFSYESIQDPLRITIHKGMIENKYISPLFLQEKYLSVALFTYHHEDKKNVLHLNCSSIQLRNLNTGIKCGKFRIINSLTFDFGSLNLIR